MYDVADDWYTYNASGAAVVILFWLIAILKLPLPLSNCVTTLSASTCDELKNGIWPKTLFCKLYNEPENEPVTRPINDPVNDPVLYDPLNVSNDVNRVEALPDVVI